MITGVSPTVLEETWSSHDVDWVLAVSNMRSRAQLTLAVNNKAQSISEVFIPYSPDVSKK